MEQLLQRRATIGAIGPALRQRTVTAVVPENTKH